MYYRNSHKNLRSIFLCIIPFLLIVFLIESSLLVSNSTKAESVPVSVNNAAVLALTVPSSVSLNLDSTTSNDFVVFDTTNLNIGIGTNNVAGYTLYMDMDFSTLDLVNSDATLDPNNNPHNITLDNNNHPTIAPLPDSLDGYTENDFVVNKWGYRIGTTGNFFPVVPRAIAIATTNTASNSTGSDVVLNLAAKTNLSQPAGTYTTTISFNAVANVIPESTCFVDTTGDLTGCTYYFNEEVYPLDSSSFYNIFFDFESAGETFSEIYITHWYDGEGGENDMYYLPNYIRICYGTLGADYMSNWADEAYRTITITGGEDATNQDVIDWLEANATRL